MLTFLLVVVIAYLLGSIPSGIIVGKNLFHKDLRRYGSGNIGASNAFRVLGKKGGALVFVMDFLKGELAAVVASVLIGTPFAVLVAGFFAVFGHMHSIFLQFRGGKGVATALGVIAIIMPKITAVLVVIWAIMAFLTHYISVASITAAVMMPILAFIYNENDSTIIFSILVAMLVIWRHKDNIERLKHGRENRF